MTSIQRVRVLSGHINSDTAYLVDDYPYGRVLRCKIRYWIETATKGAAKGQQRFVSQTTNPKLAGEVWNKPHPSTYSQIMAMYLDHNDHVKPWGVGFHLRPAEDAKMRLMGIYDQLPDAERARYDALVKISERYPQQWNEWEEKVQAIAEHISETGSTPELTNGTWQRLNRPRYYLGDDAAVYIAVAQQRADSRS